MASSVLKMHQCFPTNVLHVPPGVLNRRDLEVFGAVNSDCVIVRILPRPLRSRYSVDVAHENGTFAVVRADKLCRIK